MKEQLQEYFKKNKKEATFILAGAVFVLIGSLVGSVLPEIGELNIPEDFDRGEGNVASMLERTTLALNDTVQEFNHLVDLEEQGLNQEVLSGVGEQEEALEEIRDDLERLVINIDKMHAGVNDVSPGSLKNISEDMTRAALLAADLTLQSVNLLEQLFNNLEDKVNTGEFAPSWDGSRHSLNTYLAPLTSVLRQYSDLTDDFNEKVGSYEDE